MYISKEFLKYLILESRIPSEFPKSIYYTLINYREKDQLLLY